MIRNYVPADCQTLAELFFDTVHSVNAADYTKEQLRVWASKEVDFKDWNRSFLEHTTLIAVEHGVITGFADMDQTGYLDRLYVHRDYQRRGTAASLCRELELTVCAEKYTTHASITARPFFEKQGFQVVKEQQVVRKGISLTNFIMEKSFHRYFV